MKKLITLFFALLFSLAGYSQINTFGGVGLRVNDTTTYQTNAAAYHTAGYYDIYFNNQATNDHWDVWNGSSYDHIFSFGGSGAAALFTDASVDTVSVNSYASFIPGIVAYDTAQVYILTFLRVNTGSCDLDINGLGPATLSNYAGSNLTAGDIAAGSTHMVVYDGSEFRIVGPPFATSTARGIMSATTQTINGTKTWTSSANFQGSAVTLGTPTVGTRLFITEAGGVAGDPLVIKAISTSSFGNPSISFSGGLNSGWLSSGAMKLMFYTGKNGAETRRLAGFTAYKTSTADSSVLILETPMPATPSPGTTVAHFTMTANGKVGIGLNDISAYPGSFASSRLHVKGNVANESIFLVQEDASSRILELGETGGVKYAKLDLGSDATGDIYYRNSSGNLTRLPLGTVNQRLTNDGSVPVWRTGETSAAVAITDASTMDITSTTHTLTTSSATRTFTQSYTGDNVTLEVTLNAVSSTFTFPATSLCVSNGTASGDNTLALAGVSGDKYIIAIKKIGSAYYVVSKNFG